MNSAQNNAVPMKDWNEDEFHIRQLLKGVHTGLPCQVRDVFPLAPGEVKGNPNGPLGVVTVYLAVEQWDNNVPPQKIPGALIYNVPYFRYQAGIAAVVVDPEVGDWGWIAFGERDISKWKNTKTIDAPPSRRMLQQSDGGYFPGMLNEPPKIWIRLRKDGIVIEGDDQPITVNTTNNVTVNAENMIHLKQGGGFDAGGADFMLSGGDSWLYAHNKNERYEQAWNEQPPVPSGGGVRSPTMPENP